MPGSETEYVKSMLLINLVTKSCPTLVTPLTVAHKAPLSIGFSRQEYWSGWPFPSPGNLPDAGIEPGSPALQADSLSTELQAPHINKDFLGGSVAKTPSFLCRGKLRSYMLHKVAKKKKKKLIKK